jgi:hypothetical protein
MHEGFLLSSGLHLKAADGFPKCRKVTPYKGANLTGYSLSQS